MCRRRAGRRGRRRRARSGRRRRRRCAVSRSGPSGTGGRRRRAAPPGRRSGTSASRSPAGVSAGRCAERRAARTATRAAATAVPVTRPALVTAAPSARRSGFGEPSNAGPREENGAGPGGGPLRARHVHAAERHLRARLRLQQRLGGLAGHPTTGAAARPAGSIGSGRSCGVGEEDRGRSRAGRGGGLGGRVVAGADERDAAGQPSRSAAARALSAPVTGPASSPPPPALRRARRRRPAAPPPR